MKLPDNKFIVKLGFSNRLTVPPEIREKLQLKDGDLVQMEQIDDKSFVVTAINIVKKK